IGMSEERCTQDSRLSATKASATIDLFTLPARRRSGRRCVSRSRYCFLTSNEADELFLYRIRHSLLIVVIVVCTGASSLADDVEREVHIKTREVADCGSASTSKDSYRTQSD